MVPALWTEGSHLGATGSFAYEMVWSSGVVGTVALLVPTFGFQICGTSEESSTNAMLCEICAVSAENGTS